uniref:Kinesin-like protein n=1 Tax=Leptocylindrus danicus TaxID=163516 RepID=A0A7S2KYU7_9STRA|mmetsp:Transcript_2849/g.4085  ORF Transcript_2849/g.4085 Transcript_2849/m.4085 type:complete len:590 (+) Transcript_2849:49-1818(+)
MSEEEESKYYEEESKNDDDSKGIDVFLRIRPSKLGSSGFFTIDDFNEHVLNFRVPKAQGLIVNNTRTNYSFKFTHIIDEDSNQEEVFRKVGAPAVRNAISGFNSTIFAYGQTGSGKTFTITGGPERYADRGIIPRAISTIFKEIQSQSDINYSCFISYLEIYNENGYDLLSEEHSETSTLEDMQRVTMLEDEDGNYHFRNLSVHPVASEEDALNKLFLGDTNRAIGETEMNQASSRSHCIFTISIEGRRIGSDSVVRSKLNLVDLAGSERVHKTSSSGQTLTEAKHINSSLFFLEMVIVSLHEKSTKDKRVHVPYRNSMMTSVLRDSLGGNCMTAMIATISPEENQTDESISTCHFAQRVALVKNVAHINEDLEPEHIIRRLKTELGKLREEIKFLKGENGEDEEITQDQRNELIQQVHAYIDNKDIYATLNIGRITLAKIHDVHAIFKNIVLEAKSSPVTETSKSNSNPTNTGRELQLLRDTLAQRDREVAILVKMAKKGESISSGASAMKEILSEHKPSKENSVEKAATPSIGKAMERRVCGVERCIDSNILDVPQLAYNWFQKRFISCYTLSSFEIKGKGKWKTNN